MIVENKERQKKGRNRIEKEEKLRNNKELKEQKKWIAMVEMKSKKYGEEA